MVEEEHPGKWWVPVEVGRHLQMDDQPLFIHGVRDAVIEDPGSRRDDRKDWSAITTLGSEA
jgi:hypothetical protein